jgi:glyoxylate/hydroxypyruvate reductase A
MSEPQSRLLVYTKYAGDMPRFRELLKRELGGETSIAFATSGDEAEPHLAQVEVLYGWGFPTGMVQRMPKLRWIQKMGAGVEDLSGTNWPFGDSVLLTRTDGRLIAPRMVEYVAAAILRCTLRDDAIATLRAQRRWEYLEIGSIRKHTVGIAGLGEIGGEIANALVALGATVVGWKRVPGTCPGVSRVFTGSDEFAAFLASCSVLVLVLPHTTETAGLIGAAEISQTRPGCHLINVGRGGVVDEVALLAALDSGRLSHATLDVFAQEPLPIDHPFWRHPNVTMTPHIAGPLIPEDVVPHFVENFQAFRQGRALKNVVVPERQY